MTHIYHQADLDDYDLRLGSLYQYQQILQNLMRIFNKIAQFLISIDQYGANIRFNIHKQDRFKSLVGGFVTFVMVLLVIALFVNGLNDIIVNTRFQVQIKSEQLLNPPLDSMNPSNFMLALKASNSNLGKIPQGKRLVKIQASQIIDNLVDGVKVREVPKSYNFEPCTLDHFQSVDLEKQPTLVDMLPQYVCLPLDYRFELAGTFSSVEFKFAKISVTLCSDSECYSQEEILQADPSSGLQLSSIMMTSLPNPYDRDQIIQNFLLTDFYLQTTLKYEEYADLFFQANQVIKDDFLIRSVENDSSQKFWSFGLHDSRQFSIFRPTISTFFTLNLRKSQTSQTTKFIYLKIDDVLSYIGGIIKIVSLVFGLLAISYNELALRITLANELYNFDLPEKDEKGQVFFQQDLLNSFVQNQIERVKELMKKFKNATVRMINLARLQRHNGSQLIKAGSYTHQNSPVQVGDEGDFNCSLQGLNISFFTSVITRWLQPRQKISLGVTYIIWLLPCLDFIRSVANSRALLSKCDEMVKNDLDIVNILTRLQQISKLKHMLLNKDQTRLFHYCQAPMISIERPHQPKKKPENFLGKRHHFDNFESVQKLYLSYRNLQENHTETSERLIMMIDHNLRQIFDAQLQIEKIFFRKTQNHNGDSSAVMKTGKILCDDGLDVIFDA